jgi:hypothetical protein
MTQQLYAVVLTWRDVARNKHIEAVTVGTDKRALERTGQEWMADYAANDYEIVEAEHVEEGR